ncbi:MAG: DUF2961 domain-containing protein [Planctomycetes bacterium]|nr:DUF2961 domain-containing protein [Planctomycetota bacterium]
MIKQDVRCSVRAMRWSARRVCVRVTQPLCAWLLIAVFVPAVPPARAQDSQPVDPYSQVGLLLRMIDLDRLMTRPGAGEQSGLFSSYDRAALEAENGKYPHWDAANDANQFLGKSEDGWNIWAAIDKPGVISRIWCGKTVGEMRITIDGRVVFRTKLADLFNGTAEPFGEPLCYTIEPDAGGNCYFPIGFANSCRVESRGYDGAYQVDYTTFGPSTPVQPFTGKLDKRADEALLRVARKMKSGFTERDLLGGRKAIPWADQCDLKPKGDKASIKFDRACTVRALYVSLTDRFEPREFYALHNMVIRIWHDAESGPPDVEVPLVDFFGAGFDRNLYSSLVMGTNKVTDMPAENPQEGWFMFCYYPMPMRKGGRIEIENLNENRKAIGIMLHAISDRDEPPADALVFRARFVREDPCKTFDFPLLETKGPGRFVGVVLAVDCPRRQWWGAGDHKIWLDGQQLPGILGTGTADFFGSIEGLKPVKHAFSGVTAAAPFGKNSCYRWLVPDAVSFHSQIRVSLENQQVDKQNDVSYSAIVYWYGEADAKEKTKPLTRETLKVPGFRLPNSVEVEGNLDGKTWGSTLKERDAGIELSGGAAATITTNEPVAAKITVSKAGTYLLKLRTAPGRSFEQIDVVTADGKPIGVVKWARVPDYIYEVGRVELQAGDNTVKIKCSTKAVLDCWILEPAGS